MKKIKMKDIILNHYQKVHELEMHGMTVRVWKPRTMQQLPAYNMLGVIDYYAEVGSNPYGPDKAYWDYGNPDHGMWDALLVRYIDPRHRTLDIYFAAILVRPFSREAYEWYNRYHTGLEQIERLMLMWDSREFDRIGGYDQSYGRPANMDEWEYPLYHVVNEKDDIEDLSPDFYHEGGEEQHPGLTMKFKHDGDQVKSSASWPKQDPALVVDMPERMGVCGEEFVKFTEAHPEIKEMHFFSEPTEWEEDDEEVGV